MARTLDDDHSGSEPGAVDAEDATEFAESASREARTWASEQRLNRRVRREQWQEEFPYEWREDDLVTRRDTLRFLVAGSGALFLATSALAVAGTVRSGTQARLLQIAQEGELAENEWKVFNYPDQYAQGILINLPGQGLVAYSDVCTHLSCAVLYQPAERKLFCPCHEGLFDAASGQVLAGPPTRPLPLIQLVVRGGVVYAVQEVER
jgi:Rieske Fe-S protein